MHSDNTLFPLNQAQNTGKGERWPIGQAVPTEWLQIGYEVRKRAGLPRINMAIVAENFVDYWTSVNGARSYKRDWLATWRVWCRGTKGAPEAELSAPCQNLTENQRIMRVKAALCGARSSFLDAEDVRLALAKGAITEDQARRLGL